MSELPPGWAAKPIRDLCQRVVVGFVGPAKQHYKNGTVPFLMGKNVKRGRLELRSLERVTEQFHARERKSQLAPGDVVVVRIGRSGEAAVVPETLGAANCSGLVIVKQPEGVLPAFLATYLNSPPGQRAALDKVRGATRQTLNTASVAESICPVPPMSEQKRILSKLDSLQARSRRAREALEAVPPLLEKLRQSILAAAFRGDLTKEWRAKHPEVEPASELLRRIRVERRKKWEEAELGKMRAKGKVPADDRWKEKYKEPAPVDASGLPELPEGWCWVTLPSLGEVSRGKSQHRPRNDPRLFGDAMPFIQTGAVATSGGRVSTYSTKYSDFGVAQSRVFPRGTVCITIAANIASSAILDFDACFPDSVVGFIADRGTTVNSYVEFFIRTARAELRRFAPATAQANINLEVLGEVAVPVPPVHEMTLVVERIEHAMARLSDAQISRDFCTTQLSALEEAVLAKAFRGELVAQDATDEPAQTMLARLNGQADVASESRPKGRRGMRQRAG